MPWDHERGVIELPDGVRLRGRGLNAGDAGAPEPEWAVYLLEAPRHEPPWSSRWLCWPDFGLPRDPDAARAVFVEAHAMASAGRRVEIACEGGIGRTGTALACIAQLAGVRPQDAVAWVRAHYDPSAVETREQALFVERFSPPSAIPAG